VRAFCAALPQPGDGLRAARACARLLRSWSDFVAVKWIPRTRCASRRMRGNTDPPRPSTRKRRQAFEVVLALELRRGERCAAHRILVKL
jgi:hypothetical protein